MLETNNRILVSQRLLPELSILHNSLKNIWKKKYVTNMGEEHEKLEKKLKQELKVNNLSIFNNGTIALMVAIKALYFPEGSDVITTPFTFAATHNCLSWNKLNPIFCDIKSDTLCIDTEKIEKSITSNTSAILAVHVYRIPCDVEKIQNIANKYNLKIIYDPAHAFTTEVNNKSIGICGDITMYSFHET